MQSCFQHLGDVHRVLSDLQVAHTNQEEAVFTELHHHHQGHYTDGVPMLIGEILMQGCHASCDCSCRGLR